MNGTPQNYLVERMKNRPINIFFEDLEKGNGIKSVRDRTKAEMSIIRALARASAEIVI